METWRPPYDPYTEVRLAFASDDYLSRYEYWEADGLMPSARIDTDGERRAVLYRKVAGLMH